MLLLGIDIGTSSIKVAIVDAQSQQCITTVQYPDTETGITSFKKDGPNKAPKCGGKMYSRPF